MMSGSVIGNYILKIQQLLGSNDKKQKQMSTQQCLHNQQLFDMSIQLFKQTLEIDEVSFEQYIHDSKFIAYIKCIERIGLTLSGHYLQRQKDHLHQIESLKLKYNDLHQKLTQHMDQNYDLKAMLDHYQNQRKIYDEQLNKSQHEIQRGKHQIFNEHQTKQLLQYENQKLTNNNEELIKQNTTLESQIDKLNKQLSQTNQEIKQLKQKLTEIKTSLEAAQLEINNLKEQKFCLEKQNQSLNLLLQQKDYLLGNKIDKEKQEIPLSAEHNYPYFVRSIKVVREENQHEEEYYSDKEVLKDVQEEYRPQKHNIMILDFAKSMSYSQDRDQTTSIKVQVIEGLDESEQQEEQNIITQKNDVKLRPMKSDRKKKETAQKQVSINRSMAKIQPKLKSKQSAKLPQTPKFKQPISKQKSLTSKIKRFHCESQERSSKSIIRHKNASAEHKYIPRSNVSAILNTKTQNYELSQFALNTKKEKFEHSHSVQDFSCENELELNERQILFQRELMTRQKMIQNLKLQNRSVRRLVQQESEKRTQAQLQYEQSLQRLKSQLTFYKDEIKKVYSQFIQEKALSKAYQNQFVQVSQQFQSQKNLYENTARELREKCVHEVERHRMMYEQKYEQILRQMMKMQEQMREMEKIISNHNSSNSGNDQSNNVSSGNKSSNNSGNKNENQQSQTPQIRSEQQSRVQYQQQSGQLMKQLISPRSQQSLFPRQIKHHSHNASQQYSEINHLSRGDSKNTSVLMIDQEQYDENKEQRFINIRDYEDVFQQQQEDEQLCYQQEQGLYSYRGGQIQYYDIGVQTNYELLEQLQEQEEQKITLEYSQNYNLQNEEQKASYELTALVEMKSLQNSNIRPVEELTLNKELGNEDKSLRFSYKNQIISLTICGSHQMEQKIQTQLQSLTIEQQSTTNQATGIESNINESTMNQPSTIQPSTQISIIQTQSKHKNFTQLLQKESLLNIKQQYQVQKEQESTQTVKKTMVLEKLPQISIKSMKQQYVLIQSINEMQTQTNSGDNTPILKINNQMVGLCIVPQKKMVQNVQSQYQVLPQYYRQSYCQCQPLLIEEKGIQSSPELKQTSIQTNQIFIQQTQTQTVAEMLLMKSIDSQTSLPNLEIKSNVSQQTVDQIKPKQDKYTQSIASQFSQIEVQTTYQQFLRDKEVETEYKQNETQQIQTQSLSKLQNSMMQTQGLSQQQVQVQTQKLTIKISVQVQTQRQIQAQIISVQLQDIDVQTECQSIIQGYTQNQQQKIYKIEQQTIIKVKESKQQETQTVSQAQILNVIEIKRQYCSYESQTQTKLQDTYSTQTQIYKYSNVNVQTQYNCSNMNVQTYNQQLTQSNQTESKQLYSLDTQTQQQDRQYIDIQIQAYIMPNSIYQVQTQHLSVQNCDTQTQTQNKIIKYQQIQTQNKQITYQSMQTQIILGQSQLIQTQSNQLKHTKVQTQSLQLEQIQIQTEHKQMNQSQIQTEHKQMNQSQSQVQTQSKLIKDNSIQTQSKQIKDINTQTQSKLMTNQQSQTITIQLINIYSQTQSKSLSSTYSQTQSNKLLTQSSNISQTIYPTIKQTKKQQKIPSSQSKNSSLIDEMLMELSESMDLGQGFIQLVKRKLYMIMENIQYLQQGTQNQSQLVQQEELQQSQNKPQLQEQSPLIQDVQKQAYYTDKESQQKLSHQSSSEQQYIVSKKERRQQQLLSTYHQSSKTQEQHQQSHSLLPKPHASFEGNIKQSKASTSTSCSIGMSLSFQSPSLISKQHDLNQENKVKISSFQTIQQIQTQKYQGSALKLQGHKFQQQQQEKQLQVKKEKQLQVKKEKFQQQQQEKQLQVKKERVQFIEDNRDYESNYSGSVNRSQGQQDIMVSGKRQDLIIMSVDKDNKLIQTQVQVQIFTLKPQSMTVKRQREIRRQGVQEKHSQLCRVINQLYGGSQLQQQQRINQLQKQRINQLQRGYKQVRHKHLKKNRSNKLCKPVQLDFMTQQQFRIMVSEYKVKRIQLKQSTNQRIQQIDQRLRVNELEKNELLVIKCYSKQQNNKQNSSPNVNNRQTKSKREIMVLTQCKLLSLHEGYSFTSHKSIHHYNQHQLILGNQQIRLSIQQLKLSMNNKLNYFLGYQPKSMSYNQMQLIKSSTFNVDCIYKYKIN